MAFEFLVIISTPAKAWHGMRRDDDRPGISGSPERPLRAS
jgi:hypothetical protein